MTLSQEQVEEFFKTAAESKDRFEALFIVAVCAGLRPGEVLALKWQDLVLPDTSGSPGEARVRRSLSETKEQGWILRSTTKTGRPVYLFPEVVGALRAHRKRQLEERIRYDGMWKDEDLVFPNSLGGVMDRGAVDKRHFKPLLGKAGLPKIRLYDLRHTFATLWLESGEHPKALQEILGHSRITLTLDTCSRVTPHMQREAFGHFGERFKRGAGS